MKTVHRYEVQIDDRWHEFTLTGRIVHVACRGESLYAPVQFWALVEDLSPYTASFRVFGTGHEVPERAQYVGTAFSPPRTAMFALPPGKFVWHLFELENPTEDES